MRSAPVLLAVCLLNGAAAALSERDIFRTPGIRLAKVARQSEEPHSEKGVSVGSVEDNIYVGDITVGGKRGHSSMCLPRLSVHAVCSSVCGPA